MARPARTETPKPEAASPAEGVAPLHALHEINPFGKGQYAAAGSTFVPVTEEERNELLSLEAARELTEDEALVFAARQSAMAPTSDPASESSDDTDVIGA